MTLKTTFTAAPVY